MSESVTEPKPTHVNCHKTPTTPKLLIDKLKPKAQSRMSTVTFLRAFFAIDMQTALIQVP
jgi:hypothetical protein